MVLLPLPFRGRAAHCKILDRAPESGNDMAFEMTEHDHGVGSSNIPAMATSEKCFLLIVNPAEMFPGHARRR
jgi:hypothetical protein